MIDLELLKYTYILFVYEYLCTYVYICMYVCSLWSVTLIALPLYYALENSIQCIELCRCAYIHKWIYSYITIIHIHKVYLDINNYIYIHVYAVICNILQLSLIITKIFAQFLVREWLLRSAYVFVFENKIMQCQFAQAQRTRRSFLLHVLWHVII